MERIHCFPFSKSRFFSHWKNPHFSRCYFEGVHTEQFFPVCFLESEFLLTLRMVFDVGVGLHGWCFQLEELPLSLKLGFIWTSNPHPSSEDSSAKNLSRIFPPCPSPPFPSASSKGQESHESLTLMWAGMELKLIETFRSNNRVHLCLLMTHRQEGEMACPELGLNPSRHQSPGLILR